MGVDHRRANVFRTFLVSYLVGLPVGCCAGVLVPHVVPGAAGALVGILLFIAGLTVPGIVAIWRDHWRQR
jgi:hypothetical protein